MDQNSGANGNQVPPKVDLRKQAGQPPQGAEPAGSTIQVKPAKPATVVFKPAPAQAAGERLQTMEINPADLEAPAPAPAVSPSATVSVKPIGLPSVPGATVSKRETSRIPLEMAKPSLGAPSKPLPGPATIRVKPVIIRETVDLAQAVPNAGGAAPSGAPAGIPPTQTGKSKTSRISLESVLGGPSAISSQTAEIAPPESDDEPRTIRIKRASERPATLKTPTPQATPPPAAPGAALGQTARLELPPETPPIALSESGGQSPTRKKTIKVKRPGMEGEEEGAPVAAAVARPEPVVRMTADVPHWAFGALAVVATLVLAVLIWVLMAQAFGRNISLTTLSYGWPECDLPWPGKILPTR